MTELWLEQASNPNFVSILPNGVFKFTVSKFDRNYISKNDKKGLNIQVNIEYNGFVYTVFTTLWTDLGKDDNGKLTPLPTRCIQKIKQFFKSIKKLHLLENKTFCADNIIGSSGYAVVSIQHDESLQYPDKNTLVAFITDLSKVTIMNESNHNNSSVVATSEAGVYTPPATTEAQATPFEDGDVPF